MAMSDADVKALSERLDADPRWQKLHEQVRALSTGSGKLGRPSAEAVRPFAEAAYEILREYGVENPKDFFSGPDGDLRYKGWWGRNSDTVALIAAAAVTGGIAIPAIAGAGAAGAAGAGGGFLPAGGTAIGLTPEVASLLAGGAGTTMAGSSIWDTIAKYAKPAAEIGQVLTAGAEGRAEGRAAEALNARLEDALNLQRAEFGVRAPKARAQQTALGDVLANVQDANISVPGIAESTSTGGLRPSALGPNARQAGAALSNQALQALLSGSDMPTPSERPSPNWIDSLLNIGGTIGTGIGLTGRFNPSTPTVPPPTPTPVTPQQNAVDPTQVNRNALSRRTTFQR